MIAYLRGICHSIDGDSLIIDVRGVGYLVAVSDPDRAAHAPGQDAELLIHTEVREDAIALFGFRHADGRDLFRALLSVPGVGPKAALGLLSALQPAQLAAAIAGADVGRLVKAKGIGKKTAETICVKLRDRLPPLSAAPLPTPAKPAAAGHPLQADLLSALANLGFRANAAEAAAAVTLAADPQLSFDAALRQALAHLRRPQG